MSYLIKRRRRTPRRPVLHWSQWRIRYGLGEIWVSPAVIEDYLLGQAMQAAPLGEKLGEKIPHN